MDGRLRTYQCNSNNTVLSISSCIEGGSLFWASLVLARSQELRGRKSVFGENAKNGKLLSNGQLTPAFSKELDLTLNRGFEAADAATEKAHHPLRKVSCKLGWDNTRMQCVYIYSSSYDDRQRDQVGKKARFSLALYTEQSCSRIVPSSRRANSLVNSTLANFEREYCLLSE